MKKILGVALVVLALCIGLAGAVSAGSDMHIGDKGQGRLSSTGFGSRLGSRFQVLRCECLA